MTEAIVIGAGAAGLAAARTLLRAGITTLVLEARAVVGGRIRTVRDGFAPPLEAGAEFVHGDPHPLVKAIRVGTIRGHDVCVKDGAARRCDDEMANALRLLEAEPPERDEALAAFVSKLRAPRAEKKAALEYVAGFHAADPARASVRALAEQEDSAGDSLGRALDGYDRLVAGLEKDMAVVKNAVVRRIEWRRGAVTVAARSQQGVKLGPFRARAAIVTLPLAVLKRGAVRFAPALPAAKRAALSELEMGAVVKVALRFRQYWFDDALRDAQIVHLLGSQFPAWWTLRPLRAPILVGWCAGPRADSLRGDPARVALRTLERAFRRDLGPLLEAAHVFDWRKEPFAGGAYSWVAVGGAGAQDRLAAPVDATLFFAGEATHRTQNGTVRGALESGERAADEVLAALRSRRAAI